MKKIGIYKLTSPSGKSYIGQSTNIEQRFREHKRDTKYKHAKLYYAIRKYGYENFSKEILEECLKEDLDSKEIYWIAFFDSVNNGYNCDHGGQQSKSFGKSHKEKLRIANLGKTTEQNIPFSIDGISYRSIEEAFLKTGIARKTIHNRLNSPNDKFSTYLYDDVNLRPQRKLRKYFSKKAIVNGIAYESAAAASKDTGINFSSLCRWLRNKTNNCYYTTTETDKAGPDL